MRKEDIKQRKRGSERVKERNLQEIRCKIYKTLEITCITWYLHLYVVLLITIHTVQTCKYFCNCTTCLKGGILSLTPPKLQHEEAKFQLVRHNYRRYHVPLMKNTCVSVGGSQMFGALIGTNSRRSIMNLLV